MFGNDGIIIGMKNKERRYKQIISKLLNDEKLSNEEKEFLKKEGVE